MSTPIVNKNIMSDIVSLIRRIGALERVVASGKPDAGDIKGTAASAAPEGWFICDGSAISRTTYADLFEAIGTNFGSGDGSTTFNIPNFQGRVPVGLDSSQTEFDLLGETGGAKTHTLTVNELADHGHIQTGTTAAGATTTGTGIPPHNGAPAGGTHWAAGILSAAGASVGAVGQAHNNLQPYQVINWVIKF